MKILVTNHHLQEYTGSEVSTLVLVKYLKKFNNEVVVYSKYLDSKFIEPLTKLNIPVIDSLELVLGQTFDIAHVQHNICAYEVRHYFPKLPIVMWIHGVIPFLEIPPIIDLNISKYLVNNREGFLHLLKYGIPENNIIIFRNIIDTELFKPTSIINTKPKSALIISNKIGVEKEKLIKASLNKLKIKYTFIGKRFGVIPNQDIPKYINNSDIVFTVALGAMETMLCGRIPILFDDNYSPFNDGMVTPKNFNILKEFNFSGRAFKKTYSLSDLVKEIKQYSSNYGITLNKKASKLYDANLQVRKIIKIYENVISQKKFPKLTQSNTHILEHIVNIIWTTKHYTSIRTNKNIEPEIHNLTSEIETLKICNSTILDSLNKIQSSKTYQLWQKYNKIKRFLFNRFKYEN